MAAMTAIAIASLAVSVAGTMAAQSAQRKAAHAQEKQAAEQEKQAALQQRLQELQNQRAARDAMRKQRIAQGVLTNAAANSGTTGSSGFMGADASINAQGDANANYLSATGNAQSDIAASARTSLGLSKDIASANRSGQIAGATAGVANQVFDATGGYKTLFADNGSSGSSSGDGRIFGGDAPN